MSVNLFMRLRCFNFSIHNRCYTFTRVCSFQRLYLHANRSHSYCNPILFLEQKRFKYKKSKTLEEEDTDNEDSDEENEFGVQGVVLTGKMLSLRVDSVLKAGLKLARNKVELMFYEGRIRVNGQKIAKKSLKVNVKDEIDIVKGVSNMNPSFLSVSRVVIMKATGDEDGLIVKMKRYKNLDIENYPGEHQWSS
ncbi:uncharacterized protein C6orf203 homolog [Cimex lectularius]|uniref:Mitochondrial transcription rescue factor 1 C-terminal domain-containing protein n=1 Tax=Cimex lectularius TaxID=79782 RepID=A0A8I6SAP0_CIMLE|nr:uncharacterized protein C6orf203 homolog [Cimex lectularius]XP_014262652.1 uncharacterized protein C6orf203 homolog [Cimex lectularius]